MLGRDDLVDAVYMLLLAGAHRVVCIFHFITAPHMKLQIGDTSGDGPALSVRSGFSSPPETTKSNGEFSSFFQRRLSSPKCALCEVVNGKQRLPIVWAVHIQICKASYNCPIENIFPHEALEHGYNCYIQSSEGGE